MKVLHIGKKGNMERFSAPDSFLQRLETADCPMGLPIEAYLEAGADADFLVADAIADIPGELIRRMPKLRLIHSEGVAYNQIDVETASEQGIYVCNSQGMNASAVAEQTILLMLSALKNFLMNDRAVRCGDQIRVKENYMLQGNLPELADCAVGLVGFGDIGKETARLLRAHGVTELFCAKRTPLKSEEEAAYGIRCLPLQELLERSDIVSLHLPILPATVRMADAAFFSAMKDGSCLVNTSRGELVDDDALIRALSSGKLSMAALDTLDGEPVGREHPLLNVSADIAERMIFSPHIGGITASSFRRSYAMIWEDIRDAAEGRCPKRVVNPR